MRNVDGLLIKKNNDGTYSPRCLGTVFIDVFYNQDFLNENNVEWMWGFDQDLYSLTTVRQPNFNGITRQYPDSNQNAIFMDIPSLPDGTWEDCFKKISTSKIALFNENQWWYVLDVQPHYSQSTLLPLTTFVLAEAVVSDIGGNIEFYKNEPVDAMIASIHEDFTEFSGWKGSTSEMIDALICVLSLPKPLWVKVHAVIHTEEVMGLLRKIPEVDAFLTKQALDNQVGQNCIAGKKAATARKL